MYSLNEILEIGSGAKLIKIFEKLPNEVTKGNKKTDKKQNTKSKNEKEETKETDSVATPNGEVAFGLIKPFFKVPIDTEGEKKVIPSFGSMVEDGNIPLANVVKEINGQEKVVYSETLKSSIIANKYCDSVGLVGENRPIMGLIEILNDAFLDIKNRPGSEQEIWTILAKNVIALLSDITPSEELISKTANYFKEEYNANKSPIVTNEATKQQTMNTPNPNVNQKIETALKKANEVAIELGLKFNVTPNMGMYRVDVFNDKGVFEKDRSFWVDIDGKILNRKTKWFPVWELEANKGFEDYFVFDINDIETLRHYMSGKSIEKDRQINNPKHIAKNRIIDLMSMPTNIDNDTRNAINDTLSDLMNNGVFKRQDIKSGNRYRIVTANSGRTVMRNDAPIRYGFKVNDTEPHIELNINNLTKEVTVGTF